MSQRDEAATYQQLALYSGCIVSCEDVCNIINVHEANEQCATACWMIAIKYSVQCVFVGPLYWPEIAPAAGGQRQSPIMIRSSQAKFCQPLRDHPLVISYNAESTNTIINNGHTIQVVVNGSDSSASFSTLTWTLEARVRQMTHVISQQILVRKSRRFWW